MTAFISNHLTAVLISVAILFLVLVIKFKWYKVFFDAIELIIELLIP